MKRINKSGNVYLDISRGRVSSEYLDESVCKSLLLSTRKGVFGSRHTTSFLWGN